MNQITDDHTPISEFVKSGRITHEQARNNPSRNWLRNALGKQSFKPDYGTHEICGKAIILVSSDGMHDYLSNLKIEKVLINYGTKESLEVLVKESLESGCQDNITIVSTNI